MWHKIGKKNVKTPLPACMVKFLVCLAILLSAECAAGSCLSYGHACWGAHGKRSGSQAALSRVDNGALSSMDEAKAEWFLSKLISPLDLRYYRDANGLDAPNNQPEIDNLFTDVESVNAKSGTDWEKIREILKNNDHIPPASIIDNGRTFDNFLKSPKFLDKRSTKEQ